MQIDFEDALNPFDRTKFWYEWYWVWAEVTVLETGRPPSHAEIMNAYNESHLD